MPDGSNHSSKSTNKKSSKQPTNEATNEQTFQPAKSMILRFLPESGSETDSGQGGLSKLGSNGRGHSSMILGHRLFSHDFLYFFFLLSNLNA
jgi:hypothetical protein